MSLDKDGNGVLSREELESGFLLHNFETLPDINEILEIVDTDGSGNIDYNEFL
jgi:Ca2+-binding EF-hand superfamily protein